MQTATQKTAMQKTLKRDRNRKTAAQRSSNINHHPTPTCIKPPQLFPQKAQETRTTQQKLQCKKNARQTKTAMQKTATQKNCNASKTTRQKIQCKKNCKAKGIPKPLPSGPQTSTTARPQPASNHPNPSSRKPKKPGQRNKKLQRKKTASQKNCGTSRGRGRGSHLCSATLP